MGFLYILIQDEETTFKCFAVILEKMLRNILTQDLKRVKLLFYQMDRLIARFLPVLSEHFNVLYFFYIFLFTVLHRMKKLIQAFMPPLGF